MAYPHIFRVAISVAIVMAIVLFGLVSEDKYSIFMQKEICGIYCEMAVNYSEYVDKTYFDKYYFQKSLGPLIIHYYFLMLGTKLTPMAANHALEVLSALSLVASVFLWNGCVKRLKLSESAYWIGFSGLFVSQIFIKLVPFAEESPDTLAFALGMSMAYSVISRSLMGLCFTCVLALFTQPQLALGMIPLILLWKTDRATAIAHIPKMALKMTLLLNRLASDNRTAGLALFVLFLLVFTTAAYILPLVRSPFHGTEHSLQRLFPVAIPLAAAAMTWLLIRLDIFALTEEMFVRLFHPAARMTLFAIAMVWGVKGLIVSQLAQGPVMSLASSTLGSAYIFASFQYHAVEQPLKPWIAHLAFFGPVVLMVAYCWPRLTEACKTNGLDRAVLCIPVLVALLSSNAESRHLVAYMPLLVILSLASMQNFPKILTILFLAWTIAASRFWGNYGDAAMTGNDPWVMLWGPWWTVDTYVRGAIAVTLMIATFICAFHWLRRTEHYRRNGDST